jgi:hypothetical protein
MGKPVTLDSDDVEVLLNAAAASRKIEDILAGIRQDPAIIRLQAKGIIGDALDRCNKLRALAIQPKEARAAPPIGWIPHVEERVRLERLSAAGPMGIASDEPSHYDLLRSYGLCIAGNVNSYVNWGDKTQAMIGAGNQMRFKITMQGEAWLTALNGGKDGQS